MTKFPSRLPRDGEVVNGWEIGPPIEEWMCDEELEGEPVNEEEAFLFGYRYVCRKNQRAILFIITTELFDRAKNGDEAVIGLFWDLFVQATKYKKTIRPAKKAGLTSANNGYNPATSKQKHRGARP